MLTAPESSLVGCDEPINGWEITEKSRTLKKGLQTRKKTFLVSYVSGLKLGSQFTDSYLESGALQLKMLLVRTKVTSTCYRMDSTGSGSCS